MSDPEQRSPEWYKARIGRVTGSVAGAILNLDPNKKRADVLRRMVRDALGAESEMEDNIAIEYGRNNEDGATIEFQMETGLTVNPAPFLPYDTWLGASPDGFTSDGGVCEIKAPYSRRKRYGDKAGKEPPIKKLEDQPQYYAQLQIEMLCAGVEHAWFYQWSAKETTCDRVPIDHEWLNENLPKLRQFWAEYQDALADPEDYLAPKRIAIDTPAAARMVKEWDDLKEQEERIKERKADLLSDMVKMAGERNAEFGGRKLTLTQRQGSVAYAKVVADHAPKVDLEPYRGKPSESWGLR